MTEIQFYSSLAVGFQTVARIIITVFEEGGACQRHRAQLRLSVGTIEVVLHCKLVLFLYTLFNRNARSVSTTGPMLDAGEKEKTGTIIPSLLILSYPRTSSNTNKENETLWKVSITEWEWGIHRQSRAKESKGKERTPNHDFKTLAPESINHAYNLSSIVF